LTPIKAAKVAVVTDSVANIPPELVEKYDIRVIPLYLSVDGTLYKEGIEIGPEKVYDLLLSGSRIKSSTPSVMDFMEVYRDIQEKSCPDVIYSIHISSALSGTVNSAGAAAGSLKGINVKIIDSRMAAVGEGFMALAAAAAAKRKDSPETIESMLDDIRRQSYFYATFDNFEYVVRGGRAPFLAGFARRMMPLKAVIGFNEGGGLGLKRFCLDRNSSIKALFALIKKDMAASGMKSCLIGICYGNNAGPAEMLKDMVEDDRDIKARDVIMTRMTSVMAAHTGPGIWGISACPAFVRSL